MVENKEIMRLTVRINWKRSIAATLEGSMDVLRAKGLMEGSREAGMRLRAEYEDKRKQLMLIQGEIERLNQRREKLFPCRIESGNGWKL